MKKCTRVEGHGENMPPLQKHVFIYFDQKGIPPMVAEEFYKYHKGRKWTTDRGLPIRNWKVAAANWIWIWQQPKLLTLDQKLRQRSPFSAYDRLFSSMKGC